MLLQTALFHSFLCLSTIPLCVCVYTHTHTPHIFFIHSSVDGNLGCFHVLAMVNSAGMNIGVCVSFRIREFVFSRYIPRSGIGIAGSYGNSLIFKGTSILFSIGAVPVYIPTNSVEGSLLFTPSPASIFVDFLMMAILTSVRGYLILVLFCFF